LKNETRDKRAANLRSRWNVPPPERVPTGVGVAAHGRDDFHIVPFVPFWRAMGRNGGLGEAKGWKEEMSGTGWNPSLPRDGNRNKSDGVEAVPTR